jgi:hypothetical protein
MRPDGFDRFGSYALDFCPRYRCWAGNGPYHLHRIQFVSYPLLFPLREDLKLS